MAPEPQPRWLAYLALGIGILSIGFSAIFVRWADAPGTVISFYRMAIATLVLAWPFYRRASKHHGITPQGARLAVLGGLLFAGDLTLWSTGVMLSGATNPTLLSNTAPVWVGLGAIVFFRERLGARFWLGLALAVSGAMLILGLDALAAADLGLGSVLGLGSAIFYGGYFLSRAPEDITVGDVLRYLQKDQEETGCLACVSKKACPFLDRCAFTTLWQKVKTAAFKIYDATTMQDLLNTNEPNDKIMDQYGLGNAP